MNKQDLEHLKKELISLKKAKKEYEIKTYRYKKRKKRKLINMCQDIHELRKEFPNNAEELVEDIFLIEKALIAYEESDTFDKADYPVLVKHNIEGYQCRILLENRLRNINIEKYQMLEQMRQKYCDLDKHINKYTKNSRKKTNMYNKLIIKKYVKIKKEQFKTIINEI